ncbi:MAG: hypothetical protein E6767_14745 [Dysgonomonas sp.]|nr:hypothetical protein [Dysgonomonas sp.]
MGKRYAEAKSDLSGIKLENYIIAYDDDSESIIFDSKVKSNGFHINKERFKMMSFVMVFFIVSFSVAGWLSGIDVNLQYIAYAFVIALIIALIGTLTKGLKININFSQKLITCNSSKLLFAGIKKIYIDEYQVRNTMVKVKMLKLRTAQGKIDFLLFPLDGESEETQEQIYAWCERYLN